MSRRTKRSTFHDQVYQNNLNNAIRFKKTFRVKDRGGCTVIEYPNGHKKRFIDGSIMVSGSHLSYRIFKEVETRIKNDLYKVKNKNNERMLYNTVMFNIDVIKKSYFKKCYAIDINSCYWNVARNIGVISEEFYRKGFKEGKNWKNARNAAIGSLGAYEIETIYIDGERAGQEHSRREYNTVRSDIMDYVWEIANEISSQVKEGFCMFLTDCFFVTEDVKEKVIKLLEEKNFEYKVELIYFKNCSTTRGNINEVRWIKDTEVEGELERTDCDKVHLFNKIKHVPLWKN